MGIDNTLVMNENISAEKDYIFLLSDEVLKNCKRLTNGVYGRVYTSYLEDEEVILKRNTVHNSLRGIGSLKEIDLLRKVEYPFIVGLKGVTTDQIDIDYEDAHPSSSDEFLEDYKEDVISLIFEKADMTLEELTTKYKIPFATLRRILTQLMLSIEYMHHYRIIHRDLKPENILCRVKKPSGSTLSPEDVEIAICDFGMSDYWCKYDVQDNEVVTEYYRAPEITPSRKHYDMKIDIWSVGCIAYECFTGKALYDVSSKFKKLPRDITQWKKHIMAETTLLEIEEKNQLCDLLLNTLRSSPGSRYIAKQVLELDFFKAEKALIDEKKRECPLNAIYLTGFSVKKTELRDFFFEMIREMHSNTQLRQLSWFCDRMLFTAASIFDSVVSIIDVDTIDYKREFLMAILYIAAKFHTEKQYAAPEEIMMNITETSVSCMLKYEMLIVADVLNFRISKPTLYNRISDVEAPKDHVEKALDVLQKLKDGIYTVEELYQGHIQPVIEARKTNRKTTTKTRKTQKKEY